MQELWHYIQRTDWSDGDFIPHLLSIRISLCFWKWQHFYTTDSLFFLTFNYYYSNHLIFFLLSSGCIQLCVKDITVFKNPDVALCMCMCACGLHFSSSSFNFFHPVKHPTCKTNQSCKRIYFTWHKKVFRIFVIPQFYLKMFPRHKCNSPDFCMHRGKIKLLCVVKS